MTDLAMRLSHHATRIEQCGYLNAARSMRHAKDEIRHLREQLEQAKAAGNAAFMAMCAYRDSKDDEIFQDAIDALGVALTDDKGEK